MRITTRFAVKCSSPQRGSTGNSAANMPLHIQLFYDQKTHQASVHTSCGAVRRSGFRVPLVISQATMLVVFWFYGNVRF